MSDVVVSVPKKLWADWVEEGDTPEEPDVGMVSHFWVPHTPSRTEYGARAYVVAHGRLRGYSHLSGIEFNCQLDPWRHCIMRQGGAAVAVTIDEEIRGFQGLRYRWWSREDEVPFPSWRTEGVT